MINITLTTDWGLTDHYIAIIKGKLLKKLGNNINIIDITHNIPPFDIFYTSFIINNSIDNFPDNTIHIIGVKTKQTVYRPIIIKYSNQYIITTDNGLISLLNKKNIEKVVTYNNSNYNYSKHIFIEKDVFVDLIDFIINNNFDLNNFDIIESYQKTIYNEALMHDKMLIGNIIYINNFGNVITNISRDLFYSHVSDRKFIIKINHEKITKIDDNYNKDFGEIIAVFNSIGLLELAIAFSTINTNGSIQSLFGLKINDKISIEILN